MPISATRARRAWVTETVPANPRSTPAPHRRLLCAPNNNAGSTCSIAIGNLGRRGGQPYGTFAVTVPNPGRRSAGLRSPHRDLADGWRNGNRPTPGNNSGSDTAGEPALPICPHQERTESLGGGRVQRLPTRSPMPTPATTTRQAGVTETVPANSTFNPAPVPPLVLRAEPTTPVDLHPGGRQRRRRRRQTDRHVLPHRRQSTAGGVAQRQHGQYLRRRDNGVDTPGAVRSARDTTPSNCARVIR